MRSVGRKMNRILLLAVVLVSGFQYGCVTSRSDMLRQIHADMDRIQSQLNTTQSRQQQFADERRRAIEDMNAQLERNLDLYEPSPSAQQPTAGSEPVPSVSIDAPAALSDPEANQAFRRAQAFYNRGDYQLAADEFVIAYQYAGAEPTKARSLYWLGESFYRLKDWARAVSCFDKFETEFSDHKLLPAAMLKKGYSLLNDGQAVSGRATLRILIESFPDSAEAPLAQQRLKATE